MEGIRKEIVREERGEGKGECGKSQRGRTACGCFYRILDTPLLLCDLPLILFSSDY